MGYPSEIPNAIPERRDPPIRGAWARLLDRVLALFARRRRCRDDAPDRYGQGVDPRLPPLAPDAKQQLDFDEIARRVR